MVWLRSSVVLVALVLGCGRDVPAMELSREEPSRMTVAGVGFVMLVEREARNTSPLLVGLHGMGDTAQNFAALWHHFPMKVEIALPLAPVPHEGGRAWFAWPPGMTDQQLADAISAAEAKLWPAIAGLARGRKVMVFGFSQGAVLAYAMAVRHPDEIACAFPIAGRMPRALMPRGNARTAPVYAMHGTDDPVIEVEASRAAIAAFKAAGATAELREFAGVGHTITPEMRDDLVEQVRDVIAVRP